MAPQLSAIQNLIKTQQQKIERVVVFSAEIGAALRQEFAPYLDPEGSGVLGQAVTHPALLEKLTAFGSRLQKLEQRVAEGRQFLSQVSFMSSADALKRLTAYDLNTLTLHARTLEASAKELRSQLAAQAPQAAAAASPAEGRGLVGMFKRAIAEVDVREAPAAAKAAMPILDVATEKAKQTFEAALQFAAEVLAYVSPRLLLLKVAMDTTGLPGRKKAWDAICAELLPAATAAGVPGPQIRWLPFLVQLFYEQMSATQKAHMALVQWDEAQSMREEAELLQSTLQTTQAARASGLIARFNLAKFRGATYPLSHLHVAFKGTPTLQELFPPPA